MGLKSSLFYILRYVRPRSNEIEFSKNNVSNPDFECYNLINALLLKEKVAATLDIMVIYSSISCKKQNDIILKISFTGFHLY